jgi:hypothetical protein
MMAEDSCRMGDALTIEALGKKVQELEAALGTAHEAATAQEQARQDLIDEREQRSKELLDWVTSKRYWLGACGVGPRPLNELRRIAGVQISEEDMGKEW